jgi:hypothetical protein
MVHWGAEVASMWVEDPALAEVLASIGRPRVIEVAVPLAATERAYWVGKAVIAAFGRVKGAPCGEQGVDLYARQPLPGWAILRVHTEWEASFAAIGRGYPVAYVDPVRWAADDGDCASTSCRYAAPCGRLA